MTKLAKLTLAMVILVLAVTASVSPAMAQGGGMGLLAQTSEPIDLTAMGAGLVCVGSAYGIGKLAASALEGMARQPEVAGSIQTAMIIAAALIEGFTFFALFICFRAL